MEVLLLTLSILQLSPKANSTQKELDVLQKDSDALKRRNESLSSDLRNAHAAINQLHEEKSELDEVITMKAVECKSTQDHLSVQTSENSHLLELLDSAQAEALNFKLKLQDASSLEEEATRAVGVLKGEVDKANEKAELINEELESANVREETQSASYSRLCLFLLITLLYSRSPLFSTLFSSSLFYSIKLHSGLLIHFFSSFFVL